MAGAALAMLLLFKHTLARSVARILLLVAIAAVAASSTPLPVWIQAGWCALALVCMSLFGPAAPRARNVWLGTGFALFSAALCVWEGTYRVLPRINVAPGERIYVIGDSISAGIGGRDEVTWPAVLARTTHLNIVNLAQPGATLATARRQVAGIQSPHPLVLVEIGGNDLLGGAKPAYFRAQLDTLLVQLRSGGGTIAMFELPLLPFSNGIGEAQRSLAAKYHVTLIPKRCMTAVIGRDGDTVDGLHFSQQGHDEFAQIVERMLVIDASSQ